MPQDAGLSLKPIRGVVALCDILGFSELIKHNSLKDIIGKDLKRLQERLDFSSSAVLRNQPGVGVVWFSDTIVFYGKNDDDASFLSVLEAVRWLIFLTITTRTKIRAGISYGEFCVIPDSNILWGKAVVEAHEIEQAQQWVGGALSISAEQRLPSDIYGWPICRYEIPCSSGSGISVSNWAIDWPSYAGRRIDIRFSLDRPQPDKEDWQNMKGICEKWKNTITFHESKK